MRNHDVGPWLLIVVGAFFLVCTLISLFTGRMTLSRRHRWGFNYSYDLERDDSPLLFWIHVFIQILIGGGVLGYGIMKLVEG